MKAIPFFPFVLLLACYSAVAQKVTLSVERLTCTTAVKDFKEVTAHWIGRNDLQVESFADETPEEVIDAKSAWVHFEDNQLRLSYYPRYIKSPPNDGPGLHDLACAFPVKLTFVVRGLRRSHYQVRVTNGYSRIIEVDG